MIKKFLIKSMIIIISLYLIIGIMSAPFIMAQEIISDPIGFACNILVSVFGIDLDSQNSINDFTSLDQVITYYLQKFPETDQLFESVINEYSDKEAVAITKIELVKPFLLCSIKEPNKKDIQNYAKFIFDNCKDELDVNKAVNYIENNTPFKEVIVSNKLQDIIKISYGIYEMNSGQEVVVTGNSEIGLAIANKALSKLGLAYVWGGSHDIAAIKDPNSSKFDCSSLVCWAHYQSGIDIGSQTTKTLITMGTEILFEQLQAGDIVLFNTSGNGVSHVGIFIGDNKMVHAPRTGEVIKITELTGYYKSRLMSCRRLY